MYTTGKLHVWSAVRVMWLLAILSGLLGLSSQSQDSLQKTPSDDLARTNERLSSLVSQQPDKLSAWEELGEVQLAQHLYGDAMSSFETVLKVDPNATRSRIGEARAAISSALMDRNAGNADRALADLLRARKYTPQSLDLLIDLGIQEESMQIFQDAEGALNKALRLDPSNASALYGLAHVELDEQKITPAEGHLRAYLKLVPDDATAHYGLGHLFYMTGRNEEAKAELDRSIALRPQQTESYYELGQIALDAHIDETARKDFQRVLDATPTHGGALTGMGVLCFRTKDYAGAERYLKLAVLYAPEYIPSHRYYAMTLARLGQEDRSREELAIAQHLTERQEKLSRGYALQTVP